MQHLQQFVFERSLPWLGKNTGADDRVTKNIK